MFARLARVGFRKGLVEGSRPWLIVGGVAGTLRLANKLRKPKPRVVYCEELKPGEGLVVTHLPNR